MIRLGAHMYASRTTNGSKPHLIVQCQGDTDMHILKTSVYRIISPPCITNRTTT